MRAEFCIFESNAPGLKANFYEPYVDKPRPHPKILLSLSFILLEKKEAKTCLHWLLAVYRETESLDIIITRAFVIVITTTDLRFMHVTQRSRAFCSPHPSKRTTMTPENLWKSCHYRSPSLINKPPRKSTPENAIIIVDLVTSCQKGHVSSRLRDAEALHPRLSGVGAAKSRCTFPLSASSAYRSIK